MESMELTMGYTKCPTVRKFPWFRRVVIHNWEDWERYDEKLFSTYRGTPIKDMPYTEHMMKRQCKCCGEIERIVDPWK